jgi:hypothetical protein
MAGKTGKLQAVAKFVSKSKKRGKHSKKASNNKGSKNYSKPYNAQGR